jgi:shikimate dehydrogenase
MNLADAYYSLGVTGSPLGHSLSPRLHAAALREAGLAGEYRLYPVAPLPAGRADLEALIGRVRQADLDGLNVTIPHKQAVIPYLDALTPLAQHIGAVNTIYRSKTHAGMLHGDNTDAPGFMADLHRQWPQAPQPGAALGSNAALVLGAGGSARAVVSALLMAGWQVTLVARRLEQAQAIQAGASGILDAQAGGSQCAAISWDALPETIRAARPLSLIVNTTPVGMHPHVDRTPWPADLPFPQDVFVYDLVYNPMETKFVRAARSAGLAATNGLGMLIEQAALAFERWTGIRPSISAMRQAVTVDDQPLGGPG